MNSKILLVEDDKSLGYMLSEYLGLKGFEVEWKMDYSGAMECVKKGYFDLCVLDVMLPDKDGFVLSADIKKEYPDIPVVFLTARSMKVDLLKGFKYGADDYITKPVDEEELVARLEAILKRTERTRKRIEKEIELGQWHFSPLRQELTYNKKVVPLTKRESQLLSMLCNEIGELVPTELILRQLWGKNDFFNRRSMDVFISRLRKKLAMDPSLSIENVHGKGFILKEN